MSKEIVPHKLVVSYNEDGSVKSSILQYRLKEGGVTPNKFYTLNVKDKLYETEEKIERVHAVLSDSVDRADEVENPE